MISVEDGHAHSHVRCIPPTHVDRAGNSIEILAEKVKRLEPGCAEYVVVQQHRVQQAVAHVEDHRDAVRVLWRFEFDVDIVVEVVCRHTGKPRVESREQVVIGSRDGVRYVSP